MAENSLDKSTLDSKYFINSSVYNCPFCNRRNVVYDIALSWMFDWSANKKCYGFIVRCSSCYNHSMHLSFYSIIETTDSVYNMRKYRFSGNLESKDIDSYIFYSAPTSFFTIDNRIPNIIRELITEAEGCQKMNHLTGASGLYEKSYI